jgi:hypothetical protein
VRAPAPLCVLRAADLAAGGPALQSLHLEAELFEAAAMPAGRGQGPDGHEGG